MPSLSDRVGAAWKSFQTPKPPQPILGEVAYADPKRLFPGGHYTPYNPSDIIGRKGMGVIDRMRQDDQIKAAMAFKKGAVLATGWETASPEGMAADWEVTRFCQHVFDQIDGSLHNDIWEILTALDYGFSVNELIWERITAGPFAGHIGLKAIKTRRPHDFDFEMDEYGNLKPDGILQHGRPDGKERLPASKFILFAYDEEFSNRYGRSDLEAAYRHWWAKENALKWLIMLLEKLGIPPIYFLYDPGKLNSKQIDELKDLVRNLQAGSAGAIPRSGGSDAMDVWAPELAGQASRVYIPALEYYDRAIARAILMPGLLGLTGDQSFGSFARAKVSFDVFLLIVEKLRNDLQRLVMQEQVIKRLVDLNYTVDVYPLWRFHPLTDEVRLDIFDHWVQAIDSGIVQRREEDEPFVRQLLRFPRADSPIVPNPADLQKPPNEPERTRPITEQLRKLVGDVKEYDLSHTSPSVRNVLISRIHEAFTIAADRIYGLGYINENERVALSNAIGLMLTQLGTVLDAPDLRLVTQRLVEAPSAERLVFDYHVREALAAARDTMLEYVARNYAHAGEKFAGTIQVKNVDDIKAAAYAALRDRSHAEKAAVALRDQILEDVRNLVRAGQRQGTAIDEVLAGIRGVFEAVMKEGIT